MMPDQRNMILAVVISLLIIIGFEVVYTRLMPPPAQPSPGREQRVEERAAPDAEPAIPEPTADSATPVPQGTGQAADSAVPQPGGGTIPETAAASPEAIQGRAAALGAHARVPIDTPRLQGSIRLQGGRIDDVTLRDYRETLDPDSPEVVVLSPTGSQAPYYAEFGWVAAGAGAGQTMPGADTVWRADGDGLRPGSPLTLTWDNGAGLVFTRTIEVDENYMFTVSQAVRNTTDSAVVLHPYGLISRHGTPETTGFFILHEGLIGVMNGTLEEVDYDEIAEEDGGQIRQTVDTGWIGITDKYWLAALAFDQGLSGVAQRFHHRRVAEQDRYQVDILQPAVTVQPGATESRITRVFAGAKETPLLDEYSERFGIPNFDKAVDFGWFYFLTKPFFYVLNYFYALFGNFGFAIICFTVLLRLLMFPLADKQFKAMTKMKKLQPEMMKLKERFGDDRARMNQEMMALYKKAGTNPLSGCLPILIQIPIFFSLYKVLFVSIEMRHSPFFGWIRDLSAPDPTSIFNLFGLLPFDPPQFLMIGAWPVLMGLSMWLQQRLNPTPADPVQARVFMVLPFLFTFMLANFAAGLVIYWTTNNLLAMTQQWVIMRRAGVSVA